MNFEYTEGVPVLKNLSFSIDSGKVISFVGESGVGKSTISNLLIRFFEPTKGEIYIDGQNLNQYSLSTLRKEIGIDRYDPASGEQRIAVFELLVARDHEGSLAAAADDVPLPLQLDHHLVHRRATHAELP